MRDLSSNLLPNNSAPTHANTLNQIGSLRRLEQYLTFYKFGNTGSEVFCNLLKVTLVRAKAGKVDSAVCNLFSLAESETSSLVGT